MKNTPHNPFCGGHTAKRETLRFIYLVCTCGWSGRFPNQSGRKSRYAYFEKAVPRS